MEVPKNLVGKELGEVKNILANLGLNFNVSKSNFITTGDKNLDGKVGYVSNSGASIKVGSTIEIKLYKYEKPEPPTPTPDPEPGEPEPPTDPNESGDGSAT